MKTQTLRASRGETSTWVSSGWNEEKHRIAERKTPVHQGQVVQLLPRHPDTMSTEQDGNLRTPRHNRSVFLCPDRSHDEWKLRREAVAWLKENFRSEPNNEYFIRDEKVFTVKWLKLSWGGSFKELEGGTEEYEGAGVWATGLRRKRRAGRTVREGRRTGRGGFRS